MDFLSISSRSSLQILLREEISRGGGVWTRNGDTRIPQGKITLLRL